MHTHTGMYLTHWNRDIQAYTVTPKFITSGNFTGVSVPIYGIEQNSAEFSRSEDPSLDFALIHLFIYLLILCKYFTFGQNADRNAWTLTPAKLRFLSSLTQLLRLPVVNKLVLVGFREGAWVSTLNYLPTCTHSFPPYVLIVEDQPVKACLLCTQSVEDVWWHKVSNQNW